MNHPANFTRFCDELIDQLTPMFPDRTLIQLQSIRKNNDVTLDALIIREPGTNISPTIYLDDYYALYNDGTTIDELCHIICDVFLEVRLNHPIDPSFFTDYEKAQKKLIFQVVNYEKNKNRLQELPHIRYLDLAIIFCCILRMENGESATVTVKNEHLELWHTDIEAIKKQAFANTPRLLPAYIQPITDVIRDLAKDNPPLERLISLPDDCPDIPTLYVLTNESQIGGAACMLYPAMLSDFANTLESDLYILPSSIHEVLLLPTGTRHEDAALNELIRQVNADQLPETQQLSDHVYFYSRSSAALST